MRKKNQIFPQFLEIFVTVLKYSKAKIYLPKYGHGAREQRKFIIWNFSSSKTKYFEIPLNKLPGISYQYLNFFTYSVQINRMYQINM